jgi:hypothetical protein
VIQTGIDQVYDILMTLLHTYNMWLKGMKMLKEQHMLPLLSRINSSLEVRQQIRTSESAIELAKAQSGSPEAPGMSPADERTTQELNLSTSRRCAPMPRRVRSRYRREHTV